MHGWFQAGFGRWVSAENSGARRSNYFESHCQLRYGFNDVFVPASGRVIEKQNREGVAGLLVQSFPLLLGDSTVSIAIDIAVLLLENCLVFIFSQNAIFVCITKPHRCFVHELILI